MSNRLAIDPSEIKISDPAAVRARLWSRSPLSVSPVSDAPVVKAVEVDFRGDDEPVAVAVAPVPKPTGRPRLPSPPAPIKAEDAIALYRLAYASPDAGRRPLRHILADIAKIYNISVAEISGRRRNKHICSARQHAYYTIAIERPDLSYPYIARQMGGKDHTTVMYGAAIFASRHGLPPVVRS